MVAVKVFMASQVAFFALGVSYICLGIWFASSE